jgi:hypothetical protein
MRTGSGFIRSCSTAALLLALAAGSSAAGGQARTHDGFFLRLSTGFGWAKASIGDATGELEISGGAGDANLAVGGMVAPNLALHGTLWGWALDDPDGTLSVSGSGSSSGSFNGTLLMGAAGAGLTYYFMPANVYLSGSIGTATLTGSKQLDGESKSGFALDVTLGKEWWVGDGWGLGLSGDFQYFSVKDDTFLGLDENWSGPAVGLRFSATFN